jgi:uncharacterized membrane protein
MNNNKVEIENRVAKLIANGYQIKIGKYFEEAIEIFRVEAGLFILFTVVVAVMESVSAGLGFVLAAPFTVGYYIVAQRIKHKQEVKFEHFFDGFNKNLGGMVLLSIVSTVFIILGIMLCVLPGIYLAIAYSFAIPLVYFADYDFMEALEASRKWISKQFIDFFIFAVVILVINILGAAVFGVGLLVSIPLSYVMMYVAFEDILSQANTGKNQVTLFE